MKALANARILTDAGFIDGHAVLVDAGRIVALVPKGDAHVRHGDVEDLGGATLLPGFIDVQVNGGGGVLFNDEPTLAGIRAIGAAHRRFGTTGFLPTLISDDRAVAARAIAAVREALAAKVPGVLGVHLEGPFLNPARKGTHDAGKLRVLGEDDLRLLTSLEGGRTLVTLAPERTELSTLRRLADAGVLVCAGHTDATYEQMREALRHGVRGFTHLFNAMSPFQHRAPGAAGAALLDDASWCGLIADGWHVSVPAMQVALRCKPRDRVMLVTDAMPGVGAGDGEFLLQGKRVSMQGGVLVDEAGVISGSALDMATAVRNAVEMLGVDLAQAARMASTYPAAFLGMEGEVGRIAAGLRADFVLVDANVHVLETWIGGVPSRDLR